MDSVTRLPSSIRDPQTHAIIVEVKAVDALGRADELQVINYLKVTSMARGLLINFGARSLEVRRFVL